LTLVLSIVANSTTEQIEKLSSDVKISQREYELA